MRGGWALPVVVVLLASALVLPGIRPIPLLSPAAADAEELDEVRWTPVDSPVVLSSSLEIAASERLIIEAGVVVQLDLDVGIQVKGELQVLGDVDSPVVFQTNGTGTIGPNQWADIRLVSTLEDVQHTISYATFQGADTGLLVSSGTAVLYQCTFTQNRYGVLARGDAVLDIDDCEFLNNSVLGLEWETGAMGVAKHCTFRENVVGVYCYENVTPSVQVCLFEDNYHHMSFAQGGNTTVTECSFGPAIAEIIECYWNSSPLFRGLEVSDPEDAIVFVRKDSRPRFSGGTALSRMEVLANDNGSYAVNLMTVTVRVLDDRGKALEGANITIPGASGDVFTEGATSEDGLLRNAFLSTYTLGSPDGNDAENPHLVRVEWKGREQSFHVTPRDVDGEGVLTLEMSISLPEPSDTGWWPIIVVIITGAILIVFWVRRMH